MLILRSKLRSLACLIVSVVTFSLSFFVGNFPAQADESPSLFPPELVQVMPYQNCPVFQAAGKGNWDVKIRERGWILRENGQYKMWYTGYDGTRPGQKMLGYATSPDGLTWKRHPKNPIHKEHWVEDICIIRQGGKYHMFAEGKGDQPFYFSSSDGISWERIRALDIRLASGEPIEPGPAGTPTVWYENETWYLFYERYDRGIWLATSTDLKKWVNVQDDPVLVPGPSHFDAKLVAFNQIVKQGGWYYVYYHGSAADTEPAIWTTNIAVSDDLIHWEKYSKNPLLPLKENKSSGIVVHDGKQYRLYTMHDKVDIHFLQPSAVTAP